MKITHLNNPFNISQTYPNTIFDKNDLFASSPTNLNYENMAYSTICKFEIDCNTHDVYFNEIAFYCDNDNDFLKRYFIHVTVANFEEGIFMKIFEFNTMHIDPFNPENLSSQLVYNNMHHLDNDNPRLIAPSLFLSKILPRVVFKKFMICVTTNVKIPQFTLRNLKFHFDCDLVIRLPKTLQSNVINTLADHTNLNDFCHLIKSSIGYWDTKLIFNNHIKKIFLKNLVDLNSSFFWDFFKLPTSLFTKSIFDMLKTHFIKYPHFNLVNMKKIKLVYDNLKINLLSNWYVEYRNDKVVLIVAEKQMCKLVVFDSHGNFENERKYDNCKIVSDYKFYYVTIDETKTYQLTRNDIVDFFLNDSGKRQHLKSLIVQNNPIFYHDLNNKPRFSFLKNSQLIIMSKDMEVEFKLNLKDIFNWADPNFKISFCKSSIIFLVKTDDNLFSFSYLDVENLNFEQNIYSFNLSELRVFNFTDSLQMWSCVPTSHCREHTTNHILVNEPHLYCNYEGNKIVLAMHVADSLNYLRLSRIILVFEKNASNIKLVSSKYIPFVDVDEKNYENRKKIFLYNPFDLTDSQFLYIKFEQLPTYFVINLNTYDLNIISNGDIKIISVLDSNKLLIYDYDIYEELSIVFIDKLTDFIFRKKMYSCTSQNTNQVRIVKNTKNAI